MLEKVAQGSENDVYEVNAPPTRRDSQVVAVQRKERTQAVRTMRFAPGFHEGTLEKPRAMLARSSTPPPLPPALDDALALDGVTQVQRPPSLARTQAMVPVAPLVYAPSRPAPVAQVSHAYPMPVAYAVPREGELVAAVQALAFLHAQSAAEARRRSRLMPALFVMLVSAVLGVGVGFGLARADDLRALMRPIPKARVTGVQLTAEAGTRPLSISLSPVEVEKAPAPLPAASPIRVARAPRAPARSEGLEPTFRVTE